MAAPPTNSSFFGWLGRQIGHVKKAVVTPATPEPKIIYRNDKVEEKPMPDAPGVTLRRTTIDEVIVAPDAKAPANLTAPPKRSE